MHGKTVKPGSDSIPSTLPMRVLIFDIILEGGYVNHPLLLRQTIHQNGQVGREEEGSASKSSLRMQNL